MSAPNADNIRDWKQFLNGSKPAFARIYQAHFSSLHNYGYRLSGSSSLSKDAIQQLFVKLWNHRENLSTPASVRHYLLKAFRRILLDNQKKQAVFHDFPENHPAMIDNSQEFVLIKEIAWNEQNQYLREALEKLTKRQKEAVYLKFFENLSYDEIFTAMNLTVKSVYNLISMAIDVLRQNTPYVNYMLVTSVLTTYLNI